MTVEALRSLRGRLEPPKEAKSAERKSKRDSEREICRLSREISGKLKLFKDLLDKPIFGGRLNLGTDSEKVNWEAMPPEIAACFRPEFSFQPEDITAFYITSRENYATRGRDLSINLDRGGLWWTFLSTGAVVRKDYHGGFSHGGCVGTRGQIREAREGMERLSKLTWGDPSSELTHNINSLKMADALLVFATSEIERQIQTPQD